MILQGSNFLTKDKMRFLIREDMWSVLTIVLVREDKSV